MAEISVFLKRWGPALAMMGAIFFASSRTAADIPQFGWWDLTVKKGGHLIGYGLLGAAYLSALAGDGRPTRAQWMQAVAMAALFGGTDEFHQRFVPGRGPSAIDVAIDTIGSALGAWLMTKGSLIRHGRSG